MTDHEQTTAAAAHKVADVLLPWLVNGTLEGDELAFVEAHVRDCARCRQEVEWLRELHAACIATSDSPRAPSAGRRLRDALEAPRRATTGRRPVAAPWRWAAAGAFAAVLALGVAWFAHDDLSPMYRTLGALDAAAPASASLVVVFDPATTEFELRRILRSAGVRIVDGPTQTNAYMLDAPAADRTRALATLRAERAVMLAERLDAGARR